jgi:pimeloyl-ACP methyl ester carboxylesterase
VRVVRRAQRAPAGLFSAGLHAATLCADLRPPWGDAAAPLANREAALRRAAAAAGDPAPYDRATVVGNGLIQTCRRWPPTAAPALPGADLPPVPALLLAGDRDLSTPLPWAREQRAHTPNGRLVVVKGSGHSVQSGPRRGEALRAIRRFLLG